MSDNVSNVIERFVMREKMGETGGYAAGLGGVIGLSGGISSS
jgi:hypothetical protein